MKTRSDRPRIAAFAAVLVAAVLLAHDVLAASDEEEAAESRRQGAFYQNLGEHKKALYFYERALTFAPDSANICNDVGLMQEYLGQRKEAEQSYLKAVALDHKYLPAYSNLGMLYSREGLYEMAARYLEQRVAMGSSRDPWTLQAQEELMKIYNKVPWMRSERVRAQAKTLSDQVAQAKKKKKRSVRRDSTLDFEMAYQKGIKYLAAQRFDEAIESLGTAVALDPHSRGALKALERAQFGKEKQAIEEQAAMAQAESRHRIVDEVLNDVVSP